MARFSRAGGGMGGGGSVSLAPRLTPVVVWLAGLSIGFYLMFLLGAPKSIEEHLVLVPLLFVGRHELWTALTALLVHIDGLSLIFNLVALWLFVPALEVQWGSRRFALFFLGLGVIGNVLVGLVGWRLAPMLVYGGLTTPILATVIAFGALHPRAPVSFFGLLPLSARTLAWGIAVFALATEALGRAWPNVIADATTMLLAFLVSSPSLRQRLSLARYRERRLRRRYKVLSGGRQDWN